MKIDELIKDLEMVSDRYAKKFDIQRTDEWYFLKTTEEMGELTQSFLRSKRQARSEIKDKGLLKEELENEFADVFCTLLLLAKNQNIDIQSAIERKWLKYL